MLTLVRGPQVPAKEAPKECARMGSRAQYAGAQPSKAAPPLAECGHEVNLVGLVS